jgi:hypothetical protein
VRCRPSSAQLRYPHNAMAESFFAAIKNEWLHRFVG